jgi:hypothetical protein
VSEEQDDRSVEQFEAVHAQILRFFPELVVELGAILPIFQAGSALIPACRVQNRPTGR